MKEMMIDDFTDVTLVCEDMNYFRAHKNILSACSPVFRDKMRNLGEKSIIHLRSICSTELESIMQFIYFGEATIQEARMKQFLSLAKFLKIKELRRKTSIEADESIADIFPKESEIENEIEEEKITETVSSDSHKHDEGVRYA